jgi:WD40 repeat protein
MARETGQCRRGADARAWRPWIFEEMTTQIRTMGHYRACYCFTWDRTGRRCITGADDHLVKVWVARTGRLLRTLRGHVTEVVDICCSPDNRFVATAGSEDVRVWWLHSGVPVLVLPGHTGTISRVVFSPCLNLDATLSLLSLSLDGTTRQHRLDLNGELMTSTVYTTTNTSATVPSGAPSSAQPRIEVLCVTVDPRGTWVATGGSDRLIRFYHLQSANTLPAATWAGHLGDVTHLQVNAAADVLVSGSSDGTARLWCLRAGDLGFLQEKVRILNVRAGEDTEQAFDGGVRAEIGPGGARQRGGGQAQRRGAGSGREAGSRGGAGEAIPELKAVIFNSDHTRVVTSSGLDKARRSDWSVRLKVWCAFSGALVGSLPGHTLPVHVVDAHPRERRVVVSAGYDARVCFWDIWTCTLLKDVQISFRSDQRLLPVDHDARAAEILDGRFEPDGTGFAATHKNGWLSIVSFDDRRARFHATYTEQFFQTDVRPLEVDAQSNVIDRESQQPPHLVPQGLLCDRFGTPHDTQVAALTSVPGNVMPLLLADTQSASAPELAAGRPRGGGAPSGGTARDAMEVSDDDRRQMNGLGGGGIRSDAGSSWRESDGEWEEIHTRTREEVQDDWTASESDSGDDDDDFFATQRDGALARRLASRQRRQREERAHRASHRRWGGGESSEEEERRTTTRLRRPVRSGKDQGQISSMSEESDADLVRYV